MPKIKIDHIVSFSSEDPVHVANNILSNDPTKKWKCQNQGEKTAIVVLQLEKASVISSVDIGNEHSAYIEVLASRSSSTNADFKVLLVMSSFMTPMDARQSQNVNKVRMFTHDQLSKPECQEKWDRVKIVCTQPFNRHVQYGLSFINFHTNDRPVATQSQSTIGKFILRPESPDNLSAGSLFARRKEDKDEILKGAAAIREASTSSSLAQYGSPVCKPKLKPVLGNSTPSGTKKLNNNDIEKKCQPRNRNELLYSKDEEEPNEKIDKLIEKKMNEVMDKLNETPKNNNKTRKPSVEANSSRAKDTPKNSKNNNNESSSSSKKGKTVKSPRVSEGSKRKLKDDTDAKNKRMKKNQTKPFACLLDGVTLVISGIQNPDRGVLRAQALEMGAKYKADWDNTCSHLICAFPKTPKFNQVRGKGKIVTKKWLQDCHSQRKRLPWRRYALDRNDVGKAESEDEIWEEIQTIDDDSDVEVSPVVHGVSGSDTEEEISRIQGKLNQQRSPNVYTIDTDDENDLKRSSISKDIKNKLLDIFENKKFFIDECFSEDIYNSIHKYVIAYKGEVTDNPTEDIDVLITNSTNSTTLKEINSSGVCLKPEWVWECHNAQKLLPIDDYSV